MRKQPKCEILEGGSAASLKIRGRGDRLICPPSYPPLIDRFGRDPRRLQLLFVSDADKSE